MLRKGFILEKKPFDCDICEKRFIYKHVLANHKRIHTGEKPYTCYICEKAFSRNDNLAKHESTHTGVKPYECDVCEVT